MESGSRKRERSSFEWTNVVDISNWNFAVPNFHNQGSSSMHIGTTMSDVSSSSGDRFPVVNHREGLSEGKYESVTDELEALHAQKMRMMNFISEYRAGNSLDCSPGIVEARNVTASTTGCGLNSYEQPTEEIVLTIGQRLVKVPGDRLVSPEQPAGKMVQSTDQNILEFSIGVAAVPHNGITNHQDHVPTNQLQKKNMEVIVIDSDDEAKPPSSPRHENDNNHLLQIVLHETVHEEKMTALSNGSYCGPVSYHTSENTTPGSLGACKNIWQPSLQYQKVSLTNNVEKIPPSDLVEENSKTNFSSLMMLGSSPKPQICKSSLQSNCVGDVGTANKKKNKKTGSNVTICGKSVPLSSKDLQQESSSSDSQLDIDSEASESDGLEDLWKEMSLAMECSKSSSLDAPSVVKSEEQECDHSFMLKDDLGFVCRMCGIIGKSIEDIFDYQWTKGSKSIRTYVSESRNLKDIDGPFSLSGPKSLEQELISSEIAIHPRHEKQMKVHQLEGFNFLVRNLLADKPGGCILAHAPGSGKTFMLISFIQSFLGKYPFARPLVIIPKGILSTWKREFKKWQVEEIPLYDFYSVKAESRPQQLDVLKLWIEEKSILFLGYKQFANIVCDNTTNNAADACRESLLKVPTLLIIDEGHTPRNDNTDVLHSLSKVQTPRKVVLSGTLFQNHVKEVFNILNLVRPKFLKMTSSRSVVRRILSRVQISSTRKCKIDAQAPFCELVEETLQNDDNFKRKVTVIRDLREMTKEVLHYYKGDFLEELPGLLDFTVLLNLNYTQRSFVTKLGKMDKFRRSSLCSALYIHPLLSELAEKSGGDKCYVHEEKIDSIIERLDVNDGIKTKFILNILSMSESVGERLLVFSHYLLPLKFLERLLARLKGWRPGREMFMISGDSSPEQRELAMERINNSPDAKILFGSIKACGEGISLVGASRVIILDVHLNPSVSRQAIGRAFRPGQTKKVHVYRLVAADSFEEEDHKTSFRKELTSKMWFEWNEFRGDEEFELEAVNFSESEDAFFENPYLVEDVKCLYRR